MKTVTNKQYKEAVPKVYSLMNKGDKNITDEEAANIEEMAKAIEDYEDNVLKVMPLPVTVASTVQDKIAEIRGVFYLIPSSCVICIFDL